MKKIELIIMDAICLLTGMIALIISIYYSYKWFMDIGTPFVLSLSLSIIYIVFINMVFECSIYLFKQVYNINKNKHAVIKNKKLMWKAFMMMAIRIFLGTIIFIVWCGLVSYSMVSTIAGQYEQLVKEEKGRENINNHKEEITFQLQNVEEKISILKEENNDLKNEISTLLKRTSSITSVEDRYKYKNTTRSTERRLDDLRNKLSNNNKEIKNLLEDRNNIGVNPKSVFTVNKGTVYEYFSAIINVPPLLIQFVLSMFPSLFIDIIAPVSFAIFLYRKRKKEA